MEDSRALFRRRRAGILLPLSALPQVRPGPMDHGVLGEPARYWLDFLQRSDCSVWQLLPPGPTQQDRSPYSARSAFALDPGLIDLDELVSAGWLTEPELACGELSGERAALLQQAASHFFDADGGPGACRDYSRFLEDQSYWLEDYCLFQSIAREQGDTPWPLWPAPLRDRDPEALRSFAHRHGHWLRQCRFEQYVAHRQWEAMRARAAGMGILLFGDMPLMVSLDSADCWTHRQLFKVSPTGEPEVRVGVPPDVFAGEGQDWGMPAYQWYHCELEDFRWWRQRVARYAQWFDILRIDHFRGLESCWEIPAAARDIADGRWTPGPGRKLITALRDSAGSMPLVAENLGRELDASERLRTQSRLPGMVVMQMAFSGNPDNPHLPHNHNPHSVAYTGTHDTNTSVGWLASLAEGQVKVIEQYCGHSRDPAPVPLIRETLRSVARLAIIPLQDWLMLGPEARLNTPGVETPANWRWQCRLQQLNPALATGIGEMVRLYGRGRVAGDEVARMGPMRGF